MNLPLIRYAGIGSRETPASVLETMTDLARTFYDLGFTLQSGGATGADSAFEAGCSGRAIIYRPKGARNLSQRTWMPYSAEAKARGLEHFFLYHPAPHKCREEGHRELHMRNSFILFGSGPVMDPVQFIMCWTVDGHATGGTGQALRIAAAYTIPVFNLFYTDAIPRLGRWLRAELGVPLADPRENLSF